MSNYPNGQPYYQSNSYTGQYRNNPSYTISNAGQGQPGPNRRSSFDQGDDASLPAHAQGQPQSQYYGYAPQQQQQQQQQQSPMHSPQSTLPYRTPSQAQLGGYQHQSSPAPPVHASYNPAQYQSQPSYNPQAYGSPPTGAYNTGSFQSSYQPYVPAAYGDQPLNRTASTYNNHYTPASQNAYNSPPVPTSRLDRPQYPYTHAQSFPSDASSGYTYQGGQYSPLPSPPAPAPPPHQDSLSPARPNTHSMGSYDHYADPYSSQTSSEVNRNHSGASRNSNISNPYTSSPQPSSSEIPSRNPSQTGATTFGRHPQGSFLPGLPSESESDNERRGASSMTQPAYDDVMHTLEAAMGTSSRPNLNFNTERQRDPLFAASSPRLPASPNEHPAHNGVLPTAAHKTSYTAFASDSDVEAAAGLAAMQAAEEQEAAEEARRQSTHIHLASPGSGAERERSDDSDYTPYGDLSLAGGGYQGTMHYGSEVPAVTTTTYGYNSQLNPRMSSVRSSGVSSDAQSSGYEHLDTSQTFPTIQPGTVLVDAAGTGGLTEPTQYLRRMSYENDEGVNSDYADGGDNIPELFFHPGMNPNRPLPPPPGRSGSDSDPRASQHLSSHLSVHQNRHSAYDTVPRLYPSASDVYNNDALNPSMVPRSTSLASNRSQPRHEHPMRSKTDADRARMLKHQGTPRDGYDTPANKSDIGTLDLPAIPRKKFDPSKISSGTFDRCTEPWALSAVFAWIRAQTDEETDLKENTLTEAISALFCHKVPTISSIDADTLAQQFVQDMYSSRVLVKDEEWVKFWPGEMSGVMYQLTGLGCYSSKLHVPDASKARCYSHHCMRTVKKADFSIPDSVREIPWNAYWTLTPEQCNARGKKELERQFNMREVVYSEDAYLYGLEVLRTLYRDRLAKAGESVIPAKRLQKFVNDVFGSADQCRKVNEEYLAPQLKYRENEQGPWVVGYSDILREWIRRARPVYVEYASKYPTADMMVRDELVQNPAFTNFLDSSRREAVSNRLGWDNYLKSPIQRLQRLILQLEVVMKNSIQASDEKTNLAFAIDEIKATAHEMDVRVNEVNKTLELTMLAKKLRLRKHPGDAVDLALDHLGRTVVLRGDMMRQGGKGVSWVPCHAILFDHYLVLAKPGKDTNGNEVFDVSKPPIHMGLISLESTNDAAVTRSSVRGVTAVAGGAPAKGIDPRLARTTSGQSGSTIQHTPTGLTQSSGNSGTGTIITTTVLDTDSKEDKIYYPFKLKHLGRTEVYTLFALSADKRQEWCEAIISTKTQHAEALHAQNAEPFKLRVLADTAFGAESYSFGPRRIIIRGTPLDRAIKEVEKRYSGHGRPAPICKAGVNCATVFHQPPGRLMCAVGTDQGVFISEYQNPRGWHRSIQMAKVTQIAVLEEFNLLILLSDKVLIAYHLDVVCPPTGPPVPQSESSVRKAPQKLSGSKDVGFFLAGKMKDRVLVLYQKRDGINSIFKILEPVLQRNASSKTRWLGGSKRGQTEFFREFDEFYIPAETYGLNMFQTSLAVSTKRGLEVLTLDKKITWGVPNLESENRETQAHLDSIAARLKDVKPLGMFRLSDAEFLVAFSECAVYVNKLGDISRSVIMEFVGRAINACLYYPYLILFNEDFVEIRDAQNGRMKQVIAGRDIRMLDDGGNVTPTAGPQGASLGGGSNGLGVQGYNTAPRTVKLAMQHPEQERSYIIVEMVMRTEQP